MTIDRLLSLFATIVSVVAVPASGYFSYRYAIKGEMRKEWNALAEPVIEFFEQITQFWENEKEVHLGGMPCDEIQKLRRRMSANKRSKLDELLENFDSSVNKIKQSPAPLMWSEDGSHNKPWASPYPEAVKAAEALLKALYLR